MVQARDVREADALLKEKCKAQDWLHTHQTHEESSVVEIHHGNV